MHQKLTTFFIVPGFKEKATDKSFLWLKTFLSKKAFNVVVVSIDWNYRVMSDYINDFKKSYLKNKSKINYVLGFSYGSIITLASANDLRPNKIYLCSLSSEFKEDIPAIKPWLKKLIGKKRLKDSASRSGRGIAKKLLIPSVVFYGKKEAEYYPQLKIRCEETVKYARGSKLIIVPKSPHKIDHPEYVKIIKKELIKL